ncbi:glycoside hydrolase superfamily [Chytriomyces sp. MP71]|nr:glycoside hydrolase superfamily [Chytriomyces sp. MP71]
MEPSTIIDLADASLWKLSRATESNEITEASTEEVPAASFPTSVFSDLLNSGKIADPFVGDGGCEARLAWIGNSDWIYTARFDAADPDIHHKNPRNALLHFDGIDTCATILLNGKPVGETNSMFVPFSEVVDTQLIKKKGNVLKVVIRGATRVAKELEMVHSTRKVWNGDASRVYLRKAQYHWGWDWGPALVDSGISGRRAFLEFFDSRIESVEWDVHVAKDLSCADLMVKTHVMGDPELWADASVVISIRDPDGSVLLVKSLRLQQDLVLSTWSTLSTTHRIHVPQLWYPRGYGAQPLYSISAALLHSSSPLPLSKIAPQKFGIRLAKLIENPLPNTTDKTSFYFEINNVPVLAAGSNWIPADSFLSRATDAVYERWLNILAAGNQNMIRVWGGGLYEPDILYETCDKLGILVWQDFMFACGAYPAHADFVSNVEREARVQVARLKRFASVIFFAGNNEDYSFAESEDVGYDPHSQDEKQWAASRFPARLIYERVLPRVLEECWPAGVAYKPGSPWSKDGRSSFDTGTGDIHQWNVWHGSQEPYQKYGKLAGRFVSEFGMQAYPAIETVETFFQRETPLAEMHPLSNVVDQHNKATGFSKRIAGYLFENLRFGTSLQEFVYATQLMQAEALSTAYRLWRREWGEDGNRRVGGTLVWQLNDCWPCVSWSIVDYFFRPKASYFAIKRLLAPITVGLERVVAEDDNIFVQAWAINTTTTMHELNLIVTSFEYTSGHIVHETETKVVLRPNQSFELGRFPVSDTHHAQALVVGAILFDAEENLVASTSDWPQPLRHLPVSIPDRVVRADFEGLVEGKATFTLSALRPTKGVWLSAVMNGRMQDSAIVSMSDNMIDLMPGVEVTVVISGWQDAMQLKSDWYK